MRFFNHGFEIEELKSINEHLITCPFYQNKESVPEADIIVTTYNYILDPRIRKSMEIKIKDKIIIIDEAHNICKAAE